MSYDKPHTIEEMIPLYAAGSLSEEDRKAVEAAMEQQPGLKQDLAYFQTIKGAYSAIEKDIPPPSPDLFERIQKAIEPERSVVKARASQPLQPSFWQWLSSAFQMPRLAWGVAVAQLLVIIALLVASPPSVRYETMTNTDTQAVTAGHINVVFHPDAPEHAIRRTLVELGAVIVDGPNAEGLYRLSIDTAGTASHIVEQLKKSEIVRFAAVAP
jgi:anti-sigma factor RsiW